GYSHEIIYQPPEGVTLATPKPTEIKVTGIDPQVVGQAASEIRSYRPPALCQSRLRNPPLSPAGALQGQGCALCRRIRPPQGRQEEVSHGPETQSHPAPHATQSHAHQEECGRWPSASLGLS